MKLALRWNRHVQPWVEHVVGFHIDGRMKTVYLRPERGDARRPFAFDLEEGGIYSVNDVVKDRYVQTYVLVKNGECRQITPLEAVKHIQGVRQDVG